MELLIAFVAGVACGALLLWLALRRERGGVAWVDEAFERFTEELRAVEQRGQAREVILAQQLRQIALGHDRLARETQGLSTALRRPGVRGRYGESTLRNVVEAAGLSQYADFATQQTVRAGEHERAIRPDMTIRLPGSGIVVVDAKVPMDSFLDSLAAETDAERDALLERHAAAVRGHLQSLSAKSYWTRFERAPEFVVMFLPSESLFAAALESDPELLDAAARSRVVPVTPATMVALLRVIAFGWQETALAEGAQRVRVLANELIERLGAVASHLARTSRGLDSAVKAHNAAVGSFESRLLVTARRMSELGIQEAERLPEVEPVVTDVRDASLGLERFGEGTNIR